MAVIELSNSTRSSPEVELGSGIWAGETVTGSVTGAVTAGRAEPPQQHPYFLKYPTSKAVITMSVEQTDETTATNSSPIRVVECCEAGCCGVGWCGVGWLGRVYWLGEANWLDGAGLLLLLFGRASWSGTETGQGHTL